MATRRTLADLANLHTRPDLSSGLTEKEKRKLFEPEPKAVSVPFHKFNNVRLLLSYRILRYIGRALSIISRDEPLVTMLNRVNGSPMKPRGQPDELLQNASLIQQQMQVVPLGIRPRSLEELGHYRELFSTAALALRIKNPVVEDFTDPKRFHEAIPSQKCLEDFEYGLLEVIFDAIVDHGQTFARRELQEQFEMAPLEAQEMVAMARFVMTAPIELDQETERKIQSERLERIATKAEEQMDPRLVLAAIKERSRLLGLTDRPPENTMQEIADVIAKVSAGEDYELLE